MNPLDEASRVLQDYETNVNGDIALVWRIESAIAAASREAVAAENAACAEIARDQNLDGYEKGFAEGGALRLAHELASCVAEEIAKAIEARGEG